MSSNNLRGIKKSTSQKRIHNVSPISYFFKPGRLLLSLLAVFLLLFPFPSNSSAETQVSGYISTNTTWTLEDSPYIVTGDVRVVLNSTSTATLTIEPGVEVRFNTGAGLYIGYATSKGALSAQGTESSPITFTSNTASPAPGDWKGIYFDNGTNDGLTILEHCIVEYGGHNYTANLYLYWASPTIGNSTIRYSGNHGFILAASSPTIEGNVIAENSLDGIYIGSSSSGGLSTIISNNTFTNNGGSAVDAYPSDVKGITDNFGSGNGKNYINIKTGNLTSSCTWSRQPEGSLPYVIAGDVRVYLNSTSAATLTLEPGVEVRFNAGAGLYIGSGTSKGALSAQGTESSPITFTSNTASPAPGDWKGIYFNGTNDGLTILEHCIVEYGGHINNANLYSRNASPTIQYNTIRNSSHSGIYVYGTGSNSATIENNIISNNTTDGIYIDNFSSAQISNNTCTDNGNAAINAHPYGVKSIKNNFGSGNGKDYINIRAGIITSSCTWVRQTEGSFPYVITGDVRVFMNNSTATLTLEPGVELRFNAGTGLNIGYSNEDALTVKGALSAQGTESLPITFTSNAASPAPGDWKGIHFENGTDAGLTVLEHCVIEYGGHTNNASLYLLNASPTIQYNTIRNSSHSGIYVSEAGSNNAVINCNNLKDNLYGVYTAGNAQPQISNNNFLRNQNYGVYNESSTTVDAVNNWWGDASGPGYNGDNVYGDVNYSPWLVAESDCISTPPTNSPPFAPKNPAPVNGAVRVALTDGTVAVSWVGGDPNPWDTVVYDVYFGAASDNLVLVAQDLDITISLMSGLDVGTTYFWQVIARDNVGAETTGPVWSFTTDGPPADLVVTAVSWVPAADIEAGQEVTFTATIENNGTGPAVDAFHVDFKIDGISIGTGLVSLVIEVGGSVQVIKTWTAQTGDHSIEVVADSTGSVAESDEDNNTILSNLPNIIDPTPPELTSTLPADGASVTQANQIVMTLFDQYGTVDDAAVIGSISVINGSSQTISGSTTENSDQFTFTPDSSPLPDDTYNVSLTAADLAGNTQGYSFSFTVDGQPPAPPAITGGTITSGVIQVRPAENSSNNAVITLTGTREDNTGVWVDNVSKISIGAGEWSTALNLLQGDNALEIWVQDAAGNRSTSVWVDILIDSVAPAITSITPENNSFTNTAPSTVVIGYQETTTSLNIENSIHTVKDGNQVEVSGTWSISGGNQLIFTPSGALLESYYTVDVRLEDTLGNQGSAAQYHFTIDTTAPPAPVINPVTTPAHNPTQVISGTKEAWAALLLNGVEITGNTEVTTWQHEVTLESGQNTFTFAAKDRAGNQGEDAVAEILYDDVPPLAVDTLTVDGSGEGTTIYLDWTGYDESFHGDIASYRIYVETSNFTDVSVLTVKDTVNVGHFTYTATNLTKGTTYWFAVIAVDLMGNTLTTATTVPGVPTDTVPPENVTNLAAQSFADRLVFTWDHSANSYGDLTGYHVYFGSETEPVTLPATQNTYERAGLNTASAYDFRVFAYDNDNNDSTGVAVTGYTFLSNPTGLSAQPYSGYVDLTWTGVSPSEYVKHYHVYVNESDFTSVEGMTPVITTTSTSANVAGLTNNTTYYFAVTAVNKSDGEQKAVSTVSAMPIPDNLGPEITNVQVGGIPLLSGHTLNKPASFTLDAADPAGVSRVEFSINGSPVHTDYSPQYSYYWNIVSVADGSYTFTITAFDTLGNSTVVEYPVNVALEPPAAPNITQPGNGTVTNTTPIAVSGSAEKFTEVVLYNNSVETGSVTSVDGLGNFSFSLTLTEGENRIQAAARYPEGRTGNGPLSSEVLVTLDTTLPGSPTILTALARLAGVVRLTWQKPVDTTVSGYNIYRADLSFSSPAEATKVNANLITNIAFDDLPPQDGTWYYRVTAIDDAQNESDLSNEANAVSDNTMPIATSIGYTPQGNFDPATGTMAPGTVNVVLTVSEQLQTTPFLSIAPEGGTPVSVILTKETDITYTGFFIITDTTPTGTAYAIFSGRDIVGNRGTEIDSGGSIKIDTSGPAVRRLTISPVDPIQNDEQDPVSVTVTIGLNEAVKTGTTPQLSYLLSKEGHEPVAITLTQISPQPEEVQAWQGVFDLPADAGLTEPESFRFIYEAQDYLDNVGIDILTNNLFQVYQGELPPLDPPDGFAGVALSDGRIKLTWNEVQEAIAYQLYRQAPGESELTAYVRIESGLEYIDEPSVDGLYLYAVASIRFENEQESISSMSDTVAVNSDSVASGAPINLSLELVSNGIKAEWEPPPYTEAITYSIYRADLSEITSVEGLTPLATGIEQTMVVDPNPSPSEHCYVVTAVDDAGNESAPSNSYYLNFELLPVSSLNVIQSDDDPPQVSWTHPSSGSMAGYDIYLGPEGQSVKLNQPLLTGLSYTDTGYAQDERRYTVIAVDQDQVESLGRSITLSVLRATQAQGSMIKRGIMNRLEYTVENLSLTPVENIRLKVRVNDIDHISEPFTLQPSASNLIPVTVGGYNDLADVEDLTTTIEITPNAGEKVEIIRKSQIEVGEGMMILQISNEEFTRGGTGKVWFTLENTGEEEIEIITAKNSGNSASNHVTYSLVDEDGNVITSKPFKQGLGEGVITLSNRNTVARIPAGGTFTSASMEIDVPANAPDNVTIQLEITKIYFHHGRTDQVEMNGLSTTHQITLVETSYYGEVTRITPESSNGDQDIVITGRALERTTDSPMPGVPLNLVITLDGFERSNEVITGDDGIFSYTFTPLEGEGGVYTVRAVHPDLTDRPVHATFTINRVSVIPSSINLSIPKNYEKTVNIRVNTGDGTQVSNLRLVYEELDQPYGAFLQGVHIDTGSPIETLGSKSRANLPFTIWADNTADATGTLILKVKSDETMPDAWATVVVNTQFSEAQPVLHFTPNHLETGVAHDETVTETIVLENKGLAELSGVQIAMVNTDGSAAPSWAHLNSSEDQGNMAIGDTREISMSFSPTEYVTEGVYPFYLRITSANYPATDINLYVSVTQSGIGNVLFKISDIYTGSLDENNEIIQGLSGAKIKVQNELVLTEEYNLNTDSFGEAYFTDLPSGRYKCRITANNHQEYIGRLWIKPGITINEEVFLNYNLVTVEWEVNEIVINDKYEIVLTAVYETNVPAPVVIIEPASVTLPSMSAGDVLNGEFTLTNYGLIRADAMEFSLPADDQNFTYELLGGVPTSLNAKERITIPYRVTCLQSLDQEEDGTGGGCYTYIKCMTIDYGFYCINGVWASSSIRHCWSYMYGECGGSSSGGGTWYVGGGGGGGGSSSSPAPAPKTIEGVICFPDSERTEGCFDKCKKGPAQGDSTFSTLSSVNTVMREYNRDHTDLSIKVPGGMFETKRWYFDNTWNFEHLRHNLKFNMDSLGMGIKSIDKSGIIYDVSSVNADLFKNDTYGIKRTATGYRWESKRGEWKEFDTQGRMTSYGVRDKTLGKLIYEEGENGKLVGLADRNDVQVIWYEYNTENLISAVYDADNRRVEYGYTGGLLTSVTDLLGNETTHEYDGEGRIIKTVDVEGRESNVIYDDYGNVSSVLDSDGNGHFFVFGYDEGTKGTNVRVATSSGKIKEVWYDRDGETKRVDVNGRTLQTITKDGRDLIITDEKDNITRKEYDEWDNLTKVIYPDGSEVIYQYEYKFNRKTKETDENGNITQYEYDTAGNMTRKIEASAIAEERITEYTYDDDGNLLTTRRLGDASTPEATTVMEYDVLGNMTTVTDPEGNITRFTSHDIMGNVLTKEDARGKIWTYEYDALGHLTLITDPLGNETHIYYDKKGNKVREVDAENKEKIYEYDFHDNLVKNTDAAGNETLFEYNTDNKLTKQTDAEGKMIYYQYDNEERLIKTIDGNGNEIAMEYEDALGTGCSSCSSGSGSKPYRVIYPTFEKEFIYDKRGRKTHEKDVLIGEGQEYMTYFSFDDTGNLISKTDKEDKTNSYEYDSLNRLSKVIDPLNKDTAYSYDSRDNLIELTDANGSTTWFEYDQNNRLVKETRPMGEETTYQYDTAGNLTQKIDAKNQKTEYIYDDAGRLTEIKYFNPGDHVNPVKTVTFTYDKVGNLLTYDDGATSGEYFYDNAYRKVSETVNYGSFIKTYDYTYLKNGLKETFTGPDDIAYGYLYDSNNQLTGVQIPNSGFITISEYTWNRPKSMMLPGGSTKQFEYDPLMRVKSITAKDPGQNVLLNYQYSHDKVDNITQKATEHGDYAFNYDDLYRLTDVDNPDFDDEAFTYDGVGNRLTAEGVAGNWSYNTNNELTGYDDVSYVYDANGNMTQKTAAGVVTKFFYNTEDRLSEVRDGSDALIASYYYDPFGRRLWKEVSGTRTYFHYADEGLIGEYDSTGTEIKTYGYKPGSTWTTDPLFMKEGSSYYFYQNDHLGTPQKMTAVNGAVVWSAKYSSFGKANVDVASTITNPLRFPGQYEDTETGLHYNYHRYYDPGIGRYLRTDPMGFLGQDLNLYEYVKNNSTNFMDPNGLMIVDPYEEFIRPLENIEVGPISYAEITDQLSDLQLCILDCSLSLIEKVIATEIIFRYLHPLQNLRKIRRFAPYLFNAGEVGYLGYKMYNWTDCVEKCCEDPSDRRSKSSTLDALRRIEKMKGKIKEENSRRKQEQNRRYPPFVLASF